MGSVLGPLVAKRFLLPWLAAATLGLAGLASAQLVFTVNLTRESALSGEKLLDITPNTAFRLGDRVRIEIAFDADPELIIAARDLFVLLPVPEATSPSGGVSPGYTTSWLDVEFRVAAASDASFVFWSNQEAGPLQSSATVIAYFDVVRPAPDLSERLLGIAEQVQLGSLSGAFPDGIQEALAATASERAEAPIDPLQLLEICAQVEYGPARLRCYDAAAEELGLAPPAPPAEDSDAGSDGQP